MTDASNGASATEVIVEMSDGRKVAFPPLGPNGKGKKMIKEDLFDAHGHWVGTRFDFRFEISDAYPDNTITFKRPAADATVTVGDTKRNAREQLEAMGSRQKFGDAAAGEKDVEDMYEEVRDTIESFNDGKWSERREASGLAGTSVLLRALVLASGGKRSAEDARAYLKQFDAKTKLALRRDKTLAPIIEQLEAAKAAKAASVDTGKLLEGWA